jgi:predicted permease
MFFISKKLRRVIKMALSDLLSLPYFYLILVGALCFTIGVVFVLIHKPKNWYQFHLGFMIVGTSLSIIGIILLRGVSTVAHVYIGIASGVLLLAIITIGVIARYGKKSKKNMRTLHIWGGRLAYLFVLVTLVYGIILFL